MMDAARANVLLIMVDQWPGNLLGIAGHPVIETPTIDHLASLGTYFPNAYSECPICIPARRSVMTGDDGPSPRRPRVSTGRRHAGQTDAGADLPRRRLPGHGGG
jgi:arylsulfatase A-like enzyme